MSTPKTTPKTATSTELGSKLAYLTRALKTPTIARVWDDLAAQARDLNWSHEEYLTAVLERQVADRESAGTTMRIRTAHFPAVKTLEEFNLDHLPSLRRDLLAHLATGTFVAKAGSTAGPAGRIEVIRTYFAAEVKPHVPDAWIDWAKVKTGYEIPFTRHFYKYVPPRPLAEIDADLEKQVAKILDLLREVEG